MINYLQILNKSSGDGDDTKRHECVIRSATDLFMDQNVEVTLSPTASQIADILSNPDYPMGLVSSRVLFRPISRSAKIMRFSRQADERNTQGVNSPELRSALSKQEPESLDDILLNRKKEENLVFHTRVASASRSRSARAKRSLTRASSSSTGKKGGFLPKSTKYVRRKSASSQGMPVTSVSLIRNFPDISTQDEDADGNVIITSYSDTQARKKFFEKTDADKTVTRRQSIADDGKLSLRPKVTRMVKSLNSSRRHSNNEVETWKKKGPRGKAKSFDDKTAQSGGGLSPLDLLRLSSKSKKTSDEKGHLMLPDRPDDHSSVSSRNTLSSKRHTKGRDVSLAKKGPQSSEKKSVEIHSPRIEPSKRPKSRRKHQPKELSSAESLLPASMAKTTSKDSDVLSTSSIDSMPSMWSILSRSAYNDGTKQDEEVKMERERNVKYIKKWQWVIEEVIRRIRMRHGTGKRLGLATSHVFRWDDFVHKDSKAVVEKPDFIPEQEFDAYKEYLAKNPGVLSYLKYYTDKRKRLISEPSGTTEIKISQSKSSQDQSSKIKKDSIIQKGGTKKLSSRNILDTMTTEVDEKTMLADLASESQTGEVRDRLVSLQRSGSQSMESRKVSRASEASSSSRVSGARLSLKEEIEVDLKDSKPDASVESKWRRSSRKRPTATQSKELVYTEPMVLRPTLSGNVISKPVAANEEYKREKPVMEKLPTKAISVQEEGQDEEEQRVTPRFVMKVKRLHSIGPMVGAEGLLLKKASSDTILHLASSEFPLGRSTSDSKVSFDEVAEAKWKLDEKKNRFLGHRTPFAIHWTESSMDLTDHLQPTGLLKAIRDLKGTQPRKQIAPSVAPQEKFILKPTASQLALLQKAHVKRGISRTFSKRAMSEISLIGLPDTEEDYQDFYYTSGRKHKKTKKHVTRSSEMDIKSKESGAHVVDHDERPSEHDFSGKGSRKKPHGHRARTENVQSQDNLSTREGIEKIVTSISSLNKKHLSKESERIMTKEAGTPQLEQVTPQKPSEQKSFRDVVSHSSLEAMPSQKPNERIAQKVFSAPSLDKITSQKGSKRIARKATSVQSLEKIASPETKEKIIAKVMERIAAQKEKEKDRIKKAEAPSRETIHVHVESELSLLREDKSTASSSLTTVPSCDETIIQLPAMPSVKELQSKYVHIKRNKAEDSDRVHETLGSKAQYTEARFEELKKAPTSSLSDSSVKDFRREILKRSKQDLSMQPSVLNISEEELALKTASRNVYETQSKTMLRDRGLSVALLKDLPRSSSQEMDSDFSTKSPPEGTHSGFFKPQKSLYPEGFDVVEKRSGIIRDSFLRTQSGMDMMRRGSLFLSSAEASRHDIFLRSKEVLPPIKGHQTSDVLSKESGASTISTYPSETLSVCSGVASSAYQYGQPSDSQFSMPELYQQSSTLTYIPPSVNARKSSAVGKYDHPFVDLEALGKFREDRLYERVRVLSMANRSNRPTTHVLAPLQARQKKTKNKTFRGWDLEKPSEMQPQGHGLFQEYIDTVPSILKAMGKAKQLEGKFKHEATVKLGFVDNTLRSPASDYLSYAAYHGLEQLFEFLLTNVIVHKPANPLSYLIELTRSILKQMNLRVTMDMLLKNRKHEDAQNEVTAESRDVLGKQSQPLLEPTGSNPKLTEESFSRHGPIDSTSNDSISMFSSSSTISERF